MHSSSIVLYVILQLQILSKANKCLCQKFSKVLRHSRNHPSNSDGPPSIMSSIVSSIINACFPRPKRTQLPNLPDSPAMSFISTCPCRNRNQDGSQLSCWQPQNIFLALFRVKGIQITSIDIPNISLMAFKVTLKHQFSIHTREIS